MIAINISEELYTMKVRKSTVKANAEKYKKASKKEKAVPFEIHTLHPDNGIEVMNRVVEEFTKRYGIRYVRSRPYHKNDNPVVESWNFTLIRAHVGYCRYDTDEEYEILVELEPLISQLNNFFMPTMIRLTLLSFFFPEILNLIWVRFYCDIRRG